MRAVLALCLLVSASSLSASPSWTRDLQIDSGEFKAVNFQLYLAGNTSGIVASNKTVTGALHFNNTKLNSTPRVILALKSYGVIPSSAITSLQIGYSITITSKNATNLTYSLTTFGAAIVALHYQYLAVVGYNNVFCLQFYTVPLNSTSNTWNTALGGTRVDTFSFSNPENCTCGSNFTSSEMVMQAWPYYYTYIPTSSALSLLTTAKAESSSTFTLTVSVDNGTSLQDLAVSVLYLNTTLVYEYSYTLFIDITTYNITGSNTSTATTATTMDNITLQYQFRNSEEGVQGLYLPFSTVGTATVFYFTYTSSSTSQLYYIAIQSRARVCANSTPVYYVDDKLCHDACPTFSYALNVTYSYCKRCHYSCLQCSSADISTACTVCNGTVIRTLSNSSCLCNLTYFDNGTELCVACDYTCRTCSSTAANSCLSCDSVLHRTLANSTCGCSYGFYENTTCFACLNSCIDCGYTVANGSYTCKACNSSLHMQVDSSQMTCICSEGYYNNSGTCSPCINGCLICVDGSSCTTCNSAAHWQKNTTDNTCKCSDSFYLTTINSTSTCAACDPNCLTCSVLSTTCLTCEFSLHRTLVNATCQCASSYYENTTCISCLNNCQSCNYYQNNQTFQCFSCDSALHLTFDTNHTSCLCVNGYYNASNVCSKCGDGCLLCSVGTSCDSCDTANNWQTNVTDNTCTCVDHFFKKIVNSTATCEACHYTCLTCTDGQSNSCLSCDSSLLRNLSNAACTCSQGYYDNTTCISCNGNCLTCSIINLTYQCLTCDSSLHHQVDSSNLFCQCTNGYYNNSGTCTLCMTGCLLCSSASICSSCSSINHFALFNNTCICQSGFQLNGSLCSSVSTTATCGNGVIEIGQQCDDANTFNLDGCSSICQIQADHYCLNNITNISICYYNQPLLFTTKEIFKQPLQNRVIITLLVSAPNCNTTFLKAYLQSGISVTLLSKARLLASPDITSQSVQYDPTTSTAKVDFQYNQDIDLTKKEIKFVSSQSFAQNEGKYFYDSPSTVVTLSSPTNLLLTTYASSEEIQGFKAISNAFAALIALMWLFWLISVCYNQAATAVEYMIVVQIAFEALLQRKFITDGWIGLVIYGKYCYGYNVNYSNQEIYDRLRILSLDTYLFHTLNITTAVLVLIVVIVIAIFCYETFKVKQEPNNFDLNSTQAKIDMKVPPKTEEVAEQEQKQYKIKKGIALTLFQVGTSLSLLTVKIVVINLMMISVKVIVNVVIVASLMTACYALMWYFYYRCFDFDFLNDFSFKRLLRDSQNTKRHRSSSSKFGNFFVKYFYLCIFFLLVGFGILDGAPSFGAPFYITIIIISILILLLMIVYGVYFRNTHLVRSACNIFALIGIMVLHLLESLQASNPSQSKTGPLLCLGLLYLSFCLNFGMMGYIQYRRHRSRKVKYSSNKVAPADELVIQYTEQPLPKQPKIPVEFVEIAVEEQINEIRRSNNSSVSLAQQSKFQSLKGKSRESSVASTHKKKGVARHQHEYSQTKEKKEVERQNVDSILRNIPDFAVVRERLQAIQPGGDYQEQSEVERIEVIEINKSFSDFAKTKTKLKKDESITHALPDEPTNKKHEQFIEQSQS